MIFQNVTRIMCTLHERGTYFIIIVLFFMCYLTVHPYIMIDFLYQIDVQILYLNTFIIILYMFRALLCSSSGGQLYEHSIWYRHSL